MKTIKKTVSMLIAVAMVMTVISLVPASAYDTSGSDDTSSVVDYDLLYDHTDVQTDKDIEYSGKCGESVYCKLDEQSGVLTIYGSGDMYNYASGITNKMPPWVDYKEQVKAVVIEYGVTSIGANTFISFPQLKSISIPNSVTRIGSQFLCGTDSIEEIVIPDSVTDIDKGAFSLCGGLKNIVLPDTITVIEQGTFCYCKSLESITLGDCVTVIKQSAFQDCPSLRTVTFGSGLKTIEKAAFFMCPRIRDFYYNGTKSDWEKVEIGDCNYINMAKLHCIDSTEPAYVLGDIDRDGEMTIMDATEIQRYLACIVQYSTFDIQIADIDYDGDVTITDATHIQRVLALLESL